MNYTLELSEHFHGCWCILQFNLLVFFFPVWTVISFCVYTKRLIQGICRLSVQGIDEKSESVSQDFITASSLSASEISSSEIGINSPIYNVWNNASPPPIIQFFSCPHTVTVALFQSPSVTEDILAPANLHERLKENAVPRLLGLREIADLWLRSWFGGGGVEGSCFYMCTECGLLFWHFHYFDWYFVIVTS
jgi:hypothetical protein